MSAEPERPRGRGRPRSTEADEAILTAALELFTEGGAGAASMQAIAARAGVGRLTVYRRWSTKEELIAQAIESARADIPDPDPATLADTSLPDLIERVLPGAAETLARPDFRALLAQTLGSTQTHPRIMRAYWDHHIEPRRRVSMALLERARDAGDLPAGTDLEVLVDMMVGAVVYRVLQPRPLDAAEAERFLRAVYTQAGLLKGPAADG
ncbi:TetR/AcrR family transcriptional regulator [Nocardiopsis aegyptia]|uniref:TetR/AcrR family transcriptional regulator n=1 Tax=Nocardiopsis aegyptia TaxID=220378 RepID=UPI00366F078D